MRRRRRPTRIKERYATECEEAARNDLEPVDDASLAAAVANAAMLANCLRPGGDRGLGGGCCLEDGERLRRHFGLGEEKLCLTVTPAVPDA